MSVNKLPLRSVVIATNRPLGHWAPHQMGYTGQHVLVALVMITVMIGSMAWYAKTSVRPVNPHATTVSHAPLAAAQPIAPSTIRSVNDVVYPAQLSLVTDEQGILVGCSGAVGSPATRQMLVQYIDAALNPMSSQCQWLVDAAYNSQLIDWDTFGLLLQVIKNRPNVLLALNHDDWLSEDTVIGANGSLIVDAATPQDAERIQVALQELVGQSFALSALPAIDESAETQRSLALAERLLETLANSDRRSIDMLRVLNTQVMNFAFDQALIPEVNKPILDRVAIWLKSRPEVYLDIVGYTDNMGSVAYNLDLSQRRADAVKAYWVEQGVSAKQLNAIGRGQSQPVANNSTPQGRFRNRRIMFVQHDLKMPLPASVSAQTKDVPSTQTAK
jgi:outer membrane protein OmpA-like peptidoglycan-associated protein